jgi:acetyl esterase/lipase
MPAMTADAATRSTHPPFDTELAAGLASVPFPVIGAESLANIRTLIAEGIPGRPAPDLTVGGALAETEMTVPGPDGAPDITLLVLTPTTGTGPWPAIYHAHGGGMVLGDRRLGVDAYAPIAAEHGAVVVSVEYRLAPEHPHPAPVEDCYAGLVWTAQHAGELGIDPDRILVIGGSAGGGLTAGIALMARDRGFPHLTHQVLIYPMLDDRFITPSSHEVVGDAPWDRDANNFGWTALLGADRGGPDVSPYAAPARATDLSGLPRTYLEVGNAEVFRDETLDYAQRLSAAGVVVDLHMWGGAFHGFETFVPHARVSQTAVATRNEFIARALSG